MEQHLRQRISSDVDQVRTEVAVLANRGLLSLEDTDYMLEMLQTAEKDPIQRRGVMLAKANAYLARVEEGFC